MKRENVETVEERTTSVTYRGLNLSALGETILGRLGKAPGCPAIERHEAGTTPDPSELRRNLSARECAARSGMSPDYFWQNADKLPFASRIGRRVVFDSVGFERWLRARM